MCYLDDPALPIDNNHDEKQIRAWALGRANWLFAGSLRAGQRAAAITSLIQSAKLNGHDPYANLKDVLIRLPTHEQRDIDQLLPHRAEPWLMVSWFSPWAMGCCANAHAPLPLGESGVARRTGRGLAGHHLACTSEARPSQACRDDRTQGLLASEQSAPVGHVSVELGQLEQTLGQASACLRPSPNMHFKIKQNWIAASLKTAGRPARPLGTACHWSAGSGQTISEPQRLSEAL